MNLLTRIVSGLVAGGVTYGGLVVFSPELDWRIAAGIAGAMLVCGVAYGPKIWQAVVEIF
jgi:hypothetical protein